MSEQTTTGATPDPTGANLLVEDTAQPVNQDDQPAASPAEPTQTEDQTEPSEAPTGESVDENLEWLQKKGIDPNSPEAISKVAEMYRNAEKAMHQSTAKASELEKSLTATPTAPAVPGGDDLVSNLANEVATLKMTQTVNSFFATNPDAKALEADMAKIVTERPEVGQLVKTGYLGVQDLYAMAKGGNAGHEAQLKAEGGKEALEKVAEKQQARAVVGSATNSDLSTPDADPFLAGFDK